MYVFLIIAVFVVFLLAKGIKIVQQSETIVVERLGRYHRTLQSGINVIVPIIDKPREISWVYTKDIGGKPTQVRINLIRIDLREAVYDFPRQNVITKDNVRTEINAILYFQIIDPVKAVYEIANLPDAIEKLTQTTLRNVIGELEMDETLTSRDTINAKLRMVLDEASHKWGVKVNRVEIQEINPPADIRGAMEKQMRAERDRRALILEAEGRKTAQVLDAEGLKQSEINKAEGEKTSQILRAEGEAQSRVQVAKAEAEAIRIIVEALKSTNSDPVQYMVAIKYLEAYREMTSGQDNKVVYMPYEASGILSSLGGIKDLLMQK